jgi:glycosyltransferase involved in cell wall biosynthesis
VAPRLFAGKIITFEEQVPWEQAQKSLWSADVHLIFQGKHRLQVPAKFFECLQTGKPIMAVTSEGALSDVISQTGAGLCADSDSVSAIANALIQVLSMPARAPEDVQRQTQRFHWRTIARQFAESVKALARNATADSNASVPESIAGVRTGKQVCNDEQ